MPREQGRNRRQTCAFFVGLAILSAAAACSRRAEGPPTVVTPQIAQMDETEFTRLRDANRGRLLLINFWATWCGPCREEFPDLVRLEHEYHDRGLEVAPISLDEPETAPDIPDFLKTFGVDFRVYHEHFRDLGAVMHTIHPFWQGGIPASFLYDRQGQLVAWWEGTTPLEEFERVIKPLVAGSEPNAPPKPAGE